MAKAAISVVIGLAAVICFSPGLKAQGRPAAGAGPFGTRSEARSLGCVELGWLSWERLDEGSRADDALGRGEVQGSEVLERRAVHARGNQRSRDYQVLSPGTPRIYMQPFPFQIVQTPTEVIFLYEYDHTVRHVALDQPVPTDPDEITYMGTSVGHWENDTTLVVETVGLNENTWLDRLGTPHSDQLHVTEKFHRLDKDHLDIEVTMVDPKALTKPWGNTIHYRLHSDWKIMEQVCADNVGFLNFENPDKKK